MWQLLIIVFISLNLVNGQNNGLWSVYENSGIWKIASGHVANNIAIAQIQPNANVTGWATLDIVTNGESDDRDQAFAAGYIEGALTANLIYQSWITNLEYYYNGQLNPAAMAFAQKNDEWQRSQVLYCQLQKRGTKQYEVADCDYWYQIGLVLSQLDGMVLGYNEHCGLNKSIPYTALLFLNIADDLGDVITKLNVSNAPPNTPLQFTTDNHCSVLVKYSEETQELYHAHTTWGDYINMLRVFKHYTFLFNHPSTISKKVSFSSYPGCIASGDDYFITDTGLIVTETTNQVFNMSLYQYVQIDTVFYWLRAVVANRMSNNGSTWVQTFGKYNSGTYNNQWQVTDTKLFTPGKPFVPNTLWVLEQIPGYIVSEDLTSFLTNYGHFPSYNIPYFPFIYNISGYPSQYELYGDAYSYEACPRANIFRRDQSKVQTLQDMQNIMRYNEYQTDPLSLGDPCNAISARCDLNTTIVRAWGGYDCKVTSTAFIQNMTTTALSGPSTYIQEPFSWTSRFSSLPHYGQSTLFNFSFEVIQPSL
jgi:hypothetical protein